MSRKNISDKETKTLIALSGGVCAFPNCGKRLVEPGNASDDAAFLARWLTLLATVIKGHEATSPCPTTTGTNTLICFVVRRPSQDYRFAAKNVQCCSFATDQRGPRRSNSPSNNWLSVRTADHLGG